jgi:4-amino-4-deoxy-L-arabinose transferase-like glycosyltransferase
MVPLLSVGAFGRDSPSPPRRRGRNPSPAFGALCGGPQRISKLGVLTLLLLVAFLLRVVYLAHDRFHADEALYAGWALRILDGDPLLLDVPVDKPPLYLYTLAASMRVFGRSEVAARLPSLAASVTGIALVYRLGRTLYGRRTGLWAALFVCLSPFDILFARTAFTDPLLVLWVLVAGNAIVSDRWLGAGLAMGLAFATKQHAIALLALVPLLGWASGSLFGSSRKGCIHRILASLLGMSIPCSLVTWWDSARWAIRPGYWQQSVLSYGGLTWAEPARWDARLLEWGSWARYLVGSPLLYLLLLVGAVVLLVRGWRDQRGSALTWLDTLLAGYAVCYIGLHTVLAFSIWDRYLLPLVPLAALLLARVLEGGADWLARGRAGARLFVLCSAVVVLVALLAGGKAALNGYPVGGEHWAYQGLDRVAAYLKQHAAPDAVVYHHWLRWHYTYYLYDTDFELRWWQSSTHLRREALRTPAREQYVVLPDWGTLDPRAEDITLEPVYETRRRDGSTSFRVYRIRLAP